MGIRHVARGKGGWHDIQFLTQPGTTCLDNVDLKAYTLANLEGKSVDLTWSPPNHVPGNPLRDACVKLIHFKSKYDVFAIYRKWARIGQWGSREQSKHTADAFAGPWNHWPVGLQPSDGRYAVASDRVSSAALGGAGRIGNAIMYGITDQPVSSLVPLARSWNNPPLLTDAAGCKVRGYEQAQRAYVLTAKASSMSFTVNASESSPVYNPCFVVENWRSDAKARLSLGGERVKPGKSFRQGIVRDTEGTRSMVIWIRKTAAAPLKIEIGRGAPLPR